MKRFHLALLPLILAFPARAQSINVDFEPASTPYGSPSPNYAGSAGAPGVWNSVSTVSASGLRRWDGQSTGVSLLLSDPTPGCISSGSDPFSATDIPGTSGEDEALLDDRYVPDAWILSCTFQGLAPGDYVVDTIVGKGICQAWMWVTVPGSPDPAQELVGGTWSGSFVEGVNFVRHHKTVTDGTIQIDFELEGHVTTYMALSGIQLSMGEQELPGTPLCSADGSAVACPCANTGLPGRGCENSGDTGGAVLFATGTTSPDTVVLRSSGERSSALSVFFQGNASIVPVVFGDGLRCAGGTLKRLYIKTASAGEAFAPGPGDPSITARSAALGVPIPAGGRRYYQVQYRDPDPSFCAAPIGSTFNASSAVKVNW